MPSSLITAALQPSRPADIDVRDTLTHGDQHDLLHALAAVADPRDPRGIRYRLTSLLAVAVCAVLAGATTFAAIANWAADLDSPTRGRLGFAGSTWAAADAGLEPVADRGPSRRSTGVRPTSARSLLHLVASGVLCSDVLRILLIGSVFGVLGLTAGCSTASHAASWKAPSPGAAVTGATAAASAPAPTPSPVATVTSACTLLSTGELKALLGGASSQTKVTAVESAPDVSQGFATYDCKYGSSGKYPFDLAVTTTGQDFSPQEGIASIAKGSHTSIHAVTGVGEAGTFFTDPDGTSYVAVAKVSNDQTRTVIFAAPAVVPEQNLVDLAKLVLNRL